MTEVAQPRSAVEFHRIVMRLTARLQDGHTRAFTMGDLQRFIGSQGILPLHVAVRHERIFIRRDMSGASLSAGTEILSIDGLPSNAILRRIAPHVGVDAGSLSGVYHRLGSNYNSFYRLFPLVFGFRPSHDVVVRDSSGRVHQVVVETVSGAAFNEREQARYGNRLHINSFEEEVARPPLELRVAPDARHAVLAIRRFFGSGFNEPLDAYPGLLDEAFRRIAESGAGALIIDLRGNGGGIGGNAAHLVRYLSDSTFVPTTSMTFRGNDRYYASITDDSLGLDEYFGLERTGDLHRITRSDRITELQAFRPATGHRFRGRIIVLIDGGTVSAAGMAAGLLQQFTNATFVGEEAGGYAGMSNGLRQLSIRGLHTQSGINMPLAHSEFAVSPHRRMRGVVPDHVIVESIADLRSGRDAVMEFAVSLVK